MDGYAEEKEALKIQRKIEKLFPGLHISVRLDRW